MDDLLSEPHQADEGAQSAGHHKAALETICKEVLSARRVHINHGSWLHLTSQPCSSSSRASSLLRLFSTCRLLLRSHAASLPVFASPTSWSFCCQVTWKCTCPAHSIRYASDVTCLDLGQLRIPQFTPPGPGSVCGNQGGSAEVHRTQNLLHFLVLVSPLRGSCTRAQDR